MKSALRVRHSKDGVNGIELGIECSRRDRCCFIGFAFGNKICWRHLSVISLLAVVEELFLNIRNYYYTEKVPLSLVSRQSVLLIKVSERSKADRRTCRQALGRKQMGFAPPLPFLFFCPLPLNFDSFNSKYFHCT